MSTEEMPAAPTTGRRGLIKRGAIAAAGGLGLAALAADPAHATSGTMIYGGVNDAGADQTALTSSATNSLLVHNTNPGGTSAIRGYHAGSGWALFGGSVGGTAVRGEGVHGVFGYATGSGKGVEGQSVSGWGVNGYSMNSTAIRAHAGTEGTGNALSAECDNTKGYGVHVQGGKAQLHLQPYAATGAPTSGSHLVGEVFVDQFGRHHLCVAAGTPGTWVRPGFNPLVPFRVCDTRPGTGTPYSGTKLGPGATLAVDVVGVAGLAIPNGATAVVGNITVVGPSAGTYLTVFPGDATRPNASTINVAAGQTLANQVTTKISAAGILNVYNASGSTNILLDITGFFF
ncbi:MAG: hypothetical protein HOV79_11560 [Hamadaea sp.]|nr:hypothetical protein [Hamadaea sp.]